MHGEIGYGESGTATNGNVPYATLVQPKCLHCGRSIKQKKVVGVATGASSTTTPLEKGVTSAVAAGGSGDQSKKVWRAQTCYAKMRNAKE